MEKDRFLYMDVLRVFAFLCVTALHAVTPYISAAALMGSLSWVFCVCVNAVARAGVPLFLMLTGALLLGRDENVGTFYRRRLPRILIPIAVWDILYYLGDAALSGGALSFSAFLGAVLNNGAYYHLWYLYELLGIYLVLPFLSRACRSSSLKETAVLLVIAAFPGTIRPFLNRHLPIGIFLFDPLLEGYLGYVLLGYLLSRIRLTKKAVVLASLSLVLGLFLSIAGNIHASLEAGAPNLAMNGGYMLNHYLTAGGLFVLARRLILSPAVPGKFCGLMRTLSAATYPAYGVHAAILFALQRFIPLPSVTLSVCAFTAATALLSLAFGLVTRQTRPTRLLFG